MGCMEGMTKSFTNKLEEVEVLLYKIPRPG